WVFTQKYQSIFSEISIQLNDEVFQLNTVEATLEDEGLESNLSSLKNELRAMSLLASELPGKISAAASAENEFVTNPSPDTFANMQGEFSGVYDSVDELNSGRLAYQSGVDKLKQEISLAPIDAQTKSQLFAILQVPTGLASVGNYNLDAAQIKSSFESALSASSLKMDALLDELENRVEKNEAYNLIWGDNEDIKKGTEYISLFEAQSSILSEDNKARWKDQKKVKELEQNYARATRFYNSRNFGESLEYANESINNAVNIYKAGFMEQIYAPAISQDSLFLLAGALLAILIILYVVNNRGKLGKMVAGEDTEIDIYER
ncbi:MAG: hypothetical protein NUV67_03505, partial [archaeon]|nr:hypothetical protein [archaeon]